MSTCAHDWQPIPNWYARYRCPICHVVGVKLMAVAPRQAGIRRTEISSTAAPDGACRAVATGAARLARAACALGPCSGHRNFLPYPLNTAGALHRCPRSLPLALAALGDTGKSYFKLLAAGSRSIHRDTTRLVFLVEVFGASATASATASAMTEVMQTGQVGAEYVEYVLRHKRGLDPQPPPLRLGAQQLDAISLPEPDLSVYDQLPAARMTRDPGDPPTGQGTP